MAVRVFANFTRPEWSDHIVRDGFPLSPRTRMASLPSAITPPPKRWFLNLTSANPERALKTVRSAFLERRRCVIHYAVPDGRIIPFCTMNSIHREKIEKEFGVPVEEWRKRRKAEIDEVA